MTHVRFYQQTIMVILCKMIDREGGREGERERERERESERLGYVGGTGVQTFKHRDVYNGMSLGCV